MPKKIIIVGDDSGFKGTWYHTGQSFLVEDFDAPPPHEPGYYQPIGLDHNGTILKEHCSVLDQSGTLQTGKGNEK